MGICQIIFIVNSFRCKHFCRRRERGELDILFPTNYMPERAEAMDFSTQVGGYTSSGLFARSDTSYGYENFSSYDGARIAATPGSSNDQTLADFAKDHGFTYTPRLSKLFGRKDPGT